MHRRTWCLRAVLAAGGWGAVAGGSAPGWDSAAEALGGDEGELSAERRAGSAAAGRRFLAALFDADVQLLPEFPGSKTYWLYHDNYLAAKALERSHPEIVRAIRQSLTRWGVTESGKIEILFDEARHGWPLVHHRLDEVAQRDGKRIRTERVTDAPMRDWRSYADLLCFAAIARRKEAPAEAEGALTAAVGCWDGVGLADRVSRQNNMYATYKLALVCLAAARLDRKADVPSAVWQRLLAMQRSDGGFVTDYNREGEPLGEANVETTSLAVIALDGTGDAPVATPGSAPQ